MLLVRRADWERLLEHGHVGRRAKQQHQAMEKCNFSIRQWTGGSSKANQVYCKSLRTEWDKSGTTIRGKCLLLMITIFSSLVQGSSPQSHYMLPRCGTSGSTCCASMTDVCFIQVCGNNANNILWSHDMVFSSPQCPASYLTTFRKITILQTCIRLDSQKFPGIQVFTQNKNVYHTDGWYQDN